MIKGFRDRHTEAVFSRISVKRFGPDVQRLALRKLLQIDAATRIETLKIPPGNMLKLLQGDRVGQHSIRVNDQWRICFVWRDGDAYDVELTDYHKG
jgi:proteic killer suppression protein